MLCELCQKKTASVHLTEIVDEKIVELHVCQDCAQAKGGSGQEYLNFSNLLGAFAGKEESNQGQQIQCKNCGLDYQTFKKEGRLGCKNCYLVFKSLLLPLLKKIHGTTKHQGKVAQGRGKKEFFQSNLFKLKQDLKKAVAAEEYEKAADLRDEIKRLENKCSQK